MKRVFSQSLFALMFSFVVSAQPPIAEWSKVKEIKLLESTREDLIRIFPPNEFITWGNEFSTHFSGNESVVDVEYANGTCSDSEDWNVPAGIVTVITVTPKNPIEISRIGIDTSGFRKERTDRQRKSVYARYDKAGGVAVHLFAGRLGSIELFPSKAEYGKLCSDDKVKEYYASDRLAREQLPRHSVIDYNFPANVDELSLVPAGHGFFSVSTHAEDPEYDVLTYVYYVSAGKIVGTGANVTWDLSGVNPGIHTITAAVDDGCGICGKYVRKTVTIF